MLPRKTAVVAAVAAAVAAALHEAVPEGMAAAVQHCCTADVVVGGTPHGGFFT